MPGGRHGPGEADPAYVRMRGERVTDLGPVSLDDVENTGRQPRLGRDVRQQGRGERGPLGGLEDHRIAGGQGRGYLPSGQHQGRVPRGDQDTGACRVPRDVVRVSARLEVLVVQLQQPVREETEVVRHPGHHTPAVRAEESAIVVGLDDRQLFDPLLDAVSDGMENTGTFGTRGRGPARERRFRGSDGLGGLDGPTASDFPKGPTIDGRGVSEGGAGCDAFPTDPVPGIDGNPGDDEFFGHETAPIRGSWAELTCF